MVGVDILDGIGSTEMLHIFISNRPDDIRYGTSGKPVPGYEARIVDEHDRPVPHGEAGELVVRGDSAADGYWNQRAKTRRTFQGEWTYTGDTYTRDADGYFRFQGRSDEMLKVSGVWVSPFEVEEALISHPGRAGGRGDRPSRTATAWSSPRRSSSCSDGDHDTEALVDGVADACEGAHRRVEISALDRVRRQPAEDRHRQDPALPAAGGVMRPGTLQISRRHRWKPPGGVPARTRRPRWCCCTKAWAASPCGATCPNAWPQATGWGVFAYSRFGYGASDPTPLPRPMTYMHDEAQVVLPEVLDAAGIRQAVLVGHSDGGSIAAIYAGTQRRPSGLAAASS